MNAYPYSYFRCPCAEDSENATVSQKEDSTAAEEQPFNPFDPKSNFSLFPLEHLLWCESCHEIRCPRCVVEEIVCWYCPGCSFEVAGSMVRSEGNRCTRNCYDCPSCTANLVVTSLDPEGAAAPFILLCSHCEWTSLDIGITFDKPNNIHGQVAKMLGKQRSKVSKMLDELSHDTPIEPVRQSKSDPDARFAQLISFYKSEIARETTGNNPFASSVGLNTDYSSPGSFARIMSLYTNQGGYGKKASTKQAPMRGATGASEGVVLVDPSNDERIIERIRKEGLSSLTNTEQRLKQPHNPRFLDEMLPQATLLATKRSRRCRTCRHILVKPEAKVNTMRFRIKLIALSHIPTMTLKPLLPTAQTNWYWSALPPSKPLQLLLTLTNPMFEPTRVTLATPTQTPGRFAHRVTILCPQFMLGANADVWDEALSSGTDNRRMSKLLTTKPGATGEETKTAEAGKIWERGRNWTTIVVEVVCARIDVPLEELAEDEDVVQVPLFVRLEYEQTPTEGVASGNLTAGADTADGASASNASNEVTKIKRELAYWAVLGVGKVDRSTNP